MSEKESKKKYKTAALVLVIFLTAVIGGLCFYILTGPYDPGTLTTTGSSANLAFGGKMNSYGDYTYYIEGGSMYCINPTGNKSIVLDGENLGNINADKNYIYYTENGDVYSIHNKVVKKKLGDKKAVTMSVNGGWIYFTDEGGSMWKMDTEGQYTKQVPNVRVTGSFAVNNGFIYFAENGVIYSIRTNGLASSKKALTSDAEGFFCFFEDAIFYKSTDGSIYSMSAVDGSSKANKGSYGLFNYGFNDYCYLDGNKIGFVNQTEDLKKECEIESPETVCGIYVTKNGAVFLDKYGKTELESVDFPSAE